MFDSNSDTDDASNDNEKKNADAEGSEVERMEASTCECDGGTKIDQDFVKEHLLIILHENMYNWFAFIAELKILYRDLTKEGLEQMLHMSLLTTYQRLTSIQKKPHVGKNLVKHILQLNLKQFQRNSTGLVRCGPILRVMILKTGLT